MKDLSEVWNLIKNAEFVDIAYIRNNNMPSIRKTFIQREYRSLSRHFISTNTSSDHVKQLSYNNNACLYYSNEKDFEGLCLYGTVLIHSEKEYKEFFWHNGDERYYPHGIDDEDYCILEFAAECGAYYHNTQKLTFTASDIAEFTKMADIEEFPYKQTERKT